MYAAIALTVFVGGYQLAGMYYEARIARIDAEIAKVEAMRAEEARKAEERNRQIERDKQAEVDAIAQEFVDRNDKLQKDIAAGRATSQRLRKLLAAVGDSAPCATGPTAAVDDPAVLRQLLVHFDTFAGMCAEGADKAGEQIRGLQSYIGAIK